MKNKRTWFFLAGLAALITAFLLLDFRAAASNTRGESNIVTTSMGDQLPDAMQRKEKITLVVTGKGPLVRPLQKTMVEEMRKAGLGEVEVAQEPGKVYSNPVLRIDVGQPRVIWTPLFGTSQFSVQAGYASNGQVVMNREKPIAYDNRNGAALHMSAEYQVNDRSYGLLSRPGYYQVLADWLAKNIAEATRKLYEPKM